MAIHADTVRRIATLARLQIDTTEVEIYAGQLDRILELMQTLQQLPTEGVTPMAHAVAMSLPEREDRVCNENQRELLLACAPDTEQGYFCVPKIIE